MKLRIREKLASNSRRVAVVGSGHAAYGVCQVLAKDPRVEIDVFDIGLTGPYPNQRENPVSNAKSVNGSWFAYGVNDSRWPVALNSARICSSHAYGGFGNVYSGAVLMPRREDLKGWPEDSIPAAEDYLAVRRDVEVLDAADALADWSALEPSQSAAELGKGITSAWGWSRVAVQRFETGELRPFNPAHRFDQLRLADRIRYIPQCYVLAAEHRDSGIRLETLSKTCDTTYSGYDALFLGAGCINTTGIVHRSCRPGETRQYRVQSAAGFVQGFIGQGPRLTSELMERRENNLPEVFLELQNNDDFNGHWCHTQISAVNKYVLETISQRFSRKLTEELRRFMGSFYFAISTVPSYLNSKLPIVCTVSEKPTATALLSAIEINESSRRYMPNWRRAVRQAILHYKADLRLAHIPGSEQLGDLLRGNRLGGWHFGGTIPMCTDVSASEVSPLSCTPYGELRQSSGVFLVDSASFPSVPGTTVALLTMAHAARIARGWLNTQLR